MNLPHPFDTFRIEKKSGEYKDFGSIDSDYPLRGVTYPTDYGDIEGYIGEDGANLDVFMGTDGHIIGYIQVSRPDLAEGEHKFYVNVTETEEASILAVFQPVLINHGRYSSIEELFAAIKPYKKTT
jgi:hypothetical protein